MRSIVTEINSDGSVAIDQDADGNAAQRGRLVVRPGGMVCWEPLPPKLPAEQSAPVVQGRAPGEIGPPGGPPPGRTGAPVPPMQERTETKGNEPIPGEGGSTPASSAGQQPHVPEGYSVTTSADGEGGEGGEPIPGEGGQVPSHLA